MKVYKKKFHAEWWSWDERPKAIKKNINSSERWRGKREIDKQLEEWAETPELNAKDAYNERIDKYYNASPCVECLIGNAIEDKLKNTFLRLNIVVLIDYHRQRNFCKHNNPDTASESKT